MPVPAQNQQYENFIIRYKQNTHGGFDYESDETFQIVNDLFGILYVPMQEVPELELSSYSYSSIPRCYTYMDTGIILTLRSFRSSLSAYEYRSFFMTIKCFYRSVAVFFFDRITSISIPATRINKLINCEVESIPTLPRIRSPRKNSRTNLPML